MPASLTPKLSRSRTRISDDHSVLLESQTISKNVQVIKCEHSHRIAPSESLDPTSDSLQGGNEFCSNVPVNIGV